MDKWMNDTTAHISIALLWFLWLKKHYKKVSASADWVNMNLSNKRATAKNMM